MTPAERALARRLRDRIYRRKKKDLRLALENQPNTVYPSAHPEGELISLSGMIEERVMEMNQVECIDDLKGRGKPQMYSTIVNYN
jgi:hypothetical protein